MPGSRSAELCWGQRYHWLRYQQVPPGSRHEAHITDTYPLPAGVTVDGLRWAVTHLVRRHEVLRTVYVDTPTGPRQLVQPPAPARLRVVTSEPDGTPGPVEAIRALTLPAFDLPREWPMRALVVTTGGVPTRLHAVFNHISFDDVSLDRLRSEFAVLLGALTAGRPGVLPPVAHQPVDVARTEEGRPAPALEHWRAVLAAVPADPYARRRRPVAGSCSLALTSPGLLGTARAIADRERVWPSAVHLAAYALVTGAYTGQDKVAHRIYTSQREASGAGPVLTCLSYPTVISHDLADDPTFREVVRRAAARVQESLTHAHVPYDRVVELTAREGVRRGEPVRVAAELNFLTFDRPCGTRRDRLTRNPEPTDWATAGSDSYLRVYEWQDGVTLQLQAMAAVMDQAAVERLLRGYARLLELHRDPAVDLRATEAAAELGFDPPGPAPDPAPDRGPDPDPRAEPALLDAVARVNDLPRVDPRDCYTVAGGRALRVPQVLAALAAAGWSGLPAAALAGPEPLSRCAGRLARDAALSTGDGGR